MRKIYLLLLLLLCQFHPSHSSNVTTTSMIPGEWPRIKLSSCINVSAVELEKVTGKKFNLFQKLAYNVMRGKMKKAMRKDPDMTLDQFMQLKKKNEPVGTGLLIFAVVGLIMIMVLIVFYRAFD